LRNIDVNGTDESIIRLDDFLKRSGLVGTGGEAKLRIQSGEVRVNGEVETRRRKQLASGDVVELLGERLVVADLDDQRGPDFDGFDG
jgi:ribosome-associated protein